MFPFKTHSFCYKSRLDKERIVERIDTGLIVPEKWTVDHSNVWRGKRENDNFAIEKWINGWNSHQPVIKGQIKQLADRTTEISGYYTIRNSSIIPVFIFMALIITMSAFKGHIEVGVFGSIVILGFFIGFGYLFFIAHYKSTKEEFERLIEANASS